jgi:hypothetical protein
MSDSATHWGTRTAEQMVFPAFITDFGEVRPGPKTCIYMQAIRADMVGSKHSKKYQRAEAAMRRLEEAVTVWAEVHWHDGGVLKATP